MRARGFCVPIFEFSTVRSGTARLVTKPLAGRAGARIVETIGGTAHRPRPIISAVHSATNGTGGASTADTHHTTTDGSPATFHTPPYTHVYPANRP